MSVRRCTFALFFGSELCCTRLRCTALDVFWYSAALYYCALICTQLRCTAPNRQYWRPSGTIVMLRYSTWLRPYNASK
eukprot:183442-Rhodomonas_salina.1